MSGFSIKQGASFQLSAAIRDATDAPVVLTGTTIQSQVRDSQGNLLATLSTALPANVPGVVNLWSEGSTAAWAPGRYFCDILIVWPDQVKQQTETFGVTVLPAVTIMGSTS